MPRLRYFKPICRHCGSARFVKYYIDRWICFGMHVAPASRDTQAPKEGTDG
jgi:hypothetical protein